MASPVPDDRSLNVSVSLQRATFSLSVDTAFSLQGITGVYGPSGAGKTSLLRCIAGLEVADKSLVTLGDAVLADSGKNLHLPVEKRRIATVFQEPRLFPHLNVERNLRYGQQRAGAKAGRQSFEHVIEMLGLEALLEQASGKLSGGEAQRVAIGRALLSAPELLLMDEPLASIDDARKQDLLPYLDRLHHDGGVPMIYVSHNIDEICRLCDELAVMDSGRIVTHGDLQSVLLQTELPILGGREASAVVRGTVRSVDTASELAAIAVGDLQLLVAGETRAAGASVILRIRANDVSVCLDRPQRTSILNVLQVKIEYLQEESGGTVLLHLLAGDVALLARLSRKSCRDLSLQPGMDLYAQVKSISIRGHD